MIPPKQIGIYKITSPSGKIYIGQSWDIKNRFYSYRRLHRVEKQRFLYNSLKKYGWENHIFEILETFDNITQFELDQCEINYILLSKSLNYTLLNIREGGRGGKLPKESIIKMLETRGKWNHTEESKLKMRNARLGKYFHTEESKLKISISKKGKKPSAETLLKRSIDNKRKIASGELKMTMSENNKKIILNFETGVFYKGVEEAANAYNININTLYSKLQDKKYKNNTNLKYV